MIHRVDFKRRPASSPVGQEGEAVPSLYFAAPLFSQAELEFNARLAAEIEKLGIQVFLPQRDGIELVPGWVEMTAEER